MKIPSVPTVFDKTVIKINEKIIVRLFTAKAVYFLPIA